VGAKIYVTIDSPIIHVNFDTGGKILPFGTEQNVKLILPQIGTPPITIPAPTRHPPAKPGQDVPKTSNILAAGESPQQHYNKGSDYKGADLLHHDSRISNIIDACRTHIKQGKVLDLGSGDGYLKKYLSNDVNLKISGNASSLFDIIQMDIADDKSGNVDIIHNAEKAPYPFNDQSFDGIVCSELLEHLFNPHTVIEECHRILKSNGTMILTIPNFNCIDNVINQHQQIVYNQNHQMSVEHIRHYTLRSITQLVKGKFTINSIIGNSPNMNPFFIRARQILGKYVPDNKQYPNHQVYIDMVIGECFPDQCMGLMVILKKMG
ncbi:MAG: class I SAM-dependent methyltransferase, partial [Candidatus Omnitrophica bacterium]|nr:class I SAM-dependent methyltransferase [Candidatus Omnitrophota bacterium]